MEILYSQTILAFLMKVRRFSLAILSNEMGLKVGRTRFYIGRISYPLQFVVFDHPSKLGHFISSLYEIGINKLYLLENEEERKILGAAGKKLAEDNYSLRSYKKKLKQIYDWIELQHREIN